MAKKTQALGDCYRWAYHYVEKHPGAVLYQGYVTVPGTSRRLAHAWVTHYGMVYDWQTMVGGLGGKYRGVGYPQDVYYRLWKPEDVHAYAIEQAAAQLVQHGHYGPWKE